MEDDRFWRCIERSRRGMNYQEEQAVQLQTDLSELTPEEIIAFDEKFQKLKIESFRWELWGAAFVILGGCSDDGFDYFRNWLIAQGQEVYTQALADPDSLADLLEGNEDLVAEDEEISHAARQAYEEVTGEDFPDPPLPHPAAPAGEAWDEEELEERYPRLAELYY